MNRSLFPKPKYIQYHIETLRVCASTTLSNAPSNHLGLHPLHPPFTSVARFMLNMKHTAEEQATPTATANIAARLPHASWASCRCPPRLMFRLKIDG
jgi:hypothetical protein